MVEEILMGYILIPIAIILIFFVVYLLAVSEPKAKRDKLTKDKNP